MNKLSQSERNRLTNLILQSLKNSIPDEFQDIAVLRDISSLLIISKHIYLGNLDKAREHYSSCEIFIKDKVPDEITELLNPFNKE